MKKLFCAFLAISLLSTMAFASSYEITNKNFDRVEDLITINYSGHNEEYMTIFVYQVEPEEEAETPDWTDVENTPIIGIDQAIGTGKFDVKIKSDFTGYVVVALGGEYGDCVKVLLKVENGIPSEITDAMYENGYDAGNDSALLGDGKTITISKGGKLLNATVSTTGTGVVKYTNGDGKEVSLTGDILFDKDGAIDTVADSYVMLKTPAEDDGTFNIGFITKKTVTPNNTKYTVKVTDTSNSKSHSESFELNRLEGEVRVRIGVENVPEGTTITPTVTVE